MSKLLIITQKVDENDNHRGFFIDWLSEFAKKFDSVSVITLADGQHSLPGNVHVYSLGKERGVPKLIQAMRFYYFLLQLAPRSGGIFAHSSPIFVIASWPVAVLLRKKIILWYLHRSVTFRLKISEKLCYKIVTAAKESLNISSKKIVELGHGINIDRYKVNRIWDNKKEYKIISVGRISPIKDFESIIKAASVLRAKGFVFEVNMVGQPVMSGDVNYFDSLKSLVAKLGLEKVVRFSGFVPYNQVAHLYKEADFFVGALPAGGIDKAMLEAMASGCITLTSNNVFKKYFGIYSEKLIFEYQNPEGLALKLEDLFNSGAEDKNNISNFLIKSVAENHNINRLINKISQLYE